MKIRKLGLAVASAAAVFSLAAVTPANAQQTLVPVPAAAVPDSRWLPVPYPTLSKCVEAGMASGYDDWHCRRISNEWWTLHVYDW